MSDEINIGVPTVSVGIPENLSGRTDAIRRRKAALIAAGTEPLLAEKLAIDAEAQQALRDASLATTVAAVEVPVTATVPVAVATPDATTKKGKN